MMTFEILSTVTYVEVPYGDGTTPIGSISRIDDRSYLFNVFPGPDAPIKRCVFDVPAESFHAAIVGILVGAGYLQDPSDARPR